MVSGREAGQVSRRSGLCGEAVRLGRHWMMRAAPVDARRWRWCWGREADMAFFGQQGRVLGKLAAGGEDKR